MRYQVDCNVYAGGRNGKGELVVVSDNVPLSKQDIAEIEASKETFALKVAEQTFEHLKEKCSEAVFQDMVKKYAQKILDANDIRIKVIKISQLH